MAIVVRGHATGTLSSGTGGTLSIPQASFDTPPSSGDLVLGLIGLYDASADLPGTPSGFTSQGGAGTDGANVFAIAVTKTAGSSEGTYVVPDPGTSADESALFAAFGNATFGSVTHSSGTVTSPSVTASASTDMLVCVLVSDEASAPTISAPSGMTLLGDPISAGTGNGRHVVVAVAYQQLSASGATGTKAWTYTGGFSSDAGTASIILHLNSGTAATASGSFGFSGSAVGSVAATVTGSFSFSNGTAASSGAAAASDSFTWSDTATPQAGATSSGSFTWADTATPQGGAASSGSFAWSETASVTGTSGASGSFSFTGTAAPSGINAASGSFDLEGTATPQGATTVSGGFSWSGTANAGAQIAATASGFFQWSSAATPSDVFGPGTAYLFTPPQRRQTNVLHGRGLVWSYQVSQTVWQTDGVWYSMETPDGDTMLAADRILSLGGRPVVVDYATAQELIAAGIGTCFPIT